MKRNLILSAMLIAVLSVGAFAASSPVTSRKATTQKTENSARPAELQRQAKISMEKAREIALKRAPGTVEQGELEREHGKLVYSFDIRNAKGTITEVQVSAINGRVVRVEYEDARKEAKEKRAEEQENTKTKQP